MSEPLTFQTVRLGELRDPAFGERWDDIDGVAKITPEKRAMWLSNPCRGGDDDPVQLLAVRGRHPIGRIDLIPGWLLVRGERTTIGWGSNLTVPEQHRHTLAGAFLVMRAAGLYPATGANGPSRMALPLYEKLKFVSLPLERLILLRRSRPVVEKKLGAGGLGKLVSFFADAALGAHRFALRAWSTVQAAGVEVVPAESMPEELDGKLNVGPELVRPWRSAAWINWAITNTLEAGMAEGPPLRRSLFLLRQSGRVVGYFITKVRFYPTASASGYRNVTLGSLQDWEMFEPALSTTQIALLAMRELASQGADAMEFCVDEASARSLRRLGFARVGPFHAVIKGSSKCPLDGADLRNPSVWRLRPADADNLLA